LVFTAELARPSVVEIALMVTVPALPVTIKGVSYLIAVGELSGSVPSVV
jgi:hypothetical protein